MAIKGKKKAQNRGSQARRRPAMAPRPATTRSMKPPWYKTTAGQSIAAIATLILIVIVLVLVNNSRDAAAEREAAQQRLETYTDQVRALLQRITPPASGLSAATTAPPDDLQKQAEEWSTAFTAAQTEVGQFVAPPEGSTSRDLFLEAMRLFAAAGDTMAVAADLEGEEQTRLMTTASGQVTSASGVWDAAVAILDDARDEVDLDASGIRPPTMTPGSAAQTPAPGATIPVQTGGAGQGGGGKGGKGKKGDGGDG